jgi:polyhydroxybutyrate depolymerase
MVPTLEILLVNSAAVRRNDSTPDVDEKTHSQELTGRAIVGLSGNRFVLSLATTLAAMTLTLPASTEAEPGRLRARLKERLERQDKSPVENSGPITRAGEYRYTLRHGGEARVYLVHVPKSYQPGTPMPLVIAMHGGGGGATHMAKDENYHLIRKSDSAGFIAVFPNGTSPLRNGMLATWNAGICCGSARDEKVDDVGFIRAMIPRLNQQLTVDRQRVFAIGMSNGAMMSYRLACEMPQTIRGIMAVAGTDGTSSCTPRTPVPVLHVHARDDDHVLFEGGRGPAAKDSGKEGDYVSVPDTVRKWVSLNRATPTPQRVLTATGAYCDLHRPMPGGAPVKLCVTETGGHSWPGGAALRGKQPSTAINANDLMWDFFSTL